MHIERIKNFMAYYSSSSILTDNGSIYKKIYDLYINPLSQILICVTHRPMRNNRVDDIEALICNIQIEERNYSSFQNN